MQQYVKCASQSYLQGDGKFEQCFSATTTWKHDISQSRLQVVEWKPSFFMWIRHPPSSPSLSIHDLFPAGTNFYFLTDHWAWNGRFNYGVSMRKSNGMIPLSWSFYHLLQCFNWTNSRDPMLIRLDWSACAELEFHYTEIIGVIVTTIIAQPRFTFSCKCKQANRCRSMKVTVCARQRYGKCTDCIGFTRRDRFASAW